MWLGPEGDSSNQGMSALNDFRQAQIDTSINTSIKWDSLVREAFQSHHLMALSEAMGAVVMRPWFRRIWVIQEYALACQHFEYENDLDAVIFCCGQWEVPDIVRVLGLAPDCVEARCEADGRALANKLGTILCVLRSKDHIRIVSRHMECSGDIHGDRVTKRTVSSQNDAQDHGHLCDQIREIGFIPFWAWLTTSSAANLFFRAKSSLSTTMQAWKTPTLVSLDYVLKGRNG